MTIRLDKRKIAMQPDEESSDEEQLSSEDDFELVSDEADEITTNKGEEVKTKTTRQLDEDGDDDNSSINSDNDDTNKGEEVKRQSNSDDEENSSINSDNNDTNANTAWADSIAKILKTNKPKKKRTLVLSKAKKLTDPVKQKVKPAGFQVATADGDFKEEQIVEESKIAETDEPRRKKKKDVLSVRVKPAVLQKDRERLLSKIATKGVVQLFNAVKGQQKDISTKLKKAGPLEVRRDKVMKSVDKRAFLDVLAGETAEPVKSVVVPAKKKEKRKRKEVNAGAKSSWNVLRDDFMMSAKMRDWDKELEGEEEGEVE